jgi:zinc/manganese transport system substrate-binding protein
MHIRQHPQQGKYVLLIVLSMMALGHLRAEAMLRVVATTEHAAALAKIVGGDKIEVIALAKGHQDPHVMMPKSSFIALLNRADMLIVNGQGLEAAWLPVVLSASTNSRLLPGKPGYVDASQGAQLIPYAAEDLERPLFLNVVFGVAAALEATPPEQPSTANHHYWLDPENGASMAKAMVERLGLLDPENAAFYQENYTQFVSRLRDKVATWNTMMRPYAGAKLASYHRSWTYLANRHGLEMVGYVDPKEPLVPGLTTVSRTPGHTALAAVVARMQQQQTKLLVVETYYDHAMAAHVATRAGAHVLFLPASVSQHEGVGEYFQFFDRVYMELVQALNRARN